MNPFSLLTNLTLNEVLKKELSDPVTGVKTVGETMVVQLLVFDETLGKAITNCLFTFQFPFHI